MKPHLKQVVAVAIGLYALQGLTGCTTPKNTIAIRESETKPLYIKGVPHLISKGAHGGVALALLTPTYSESLDELPSFYVMYSNNGEANVDLDVSNVRVVSAGKPVRVYSHLELTKKIDKAAQRRRLGAAIGAGMQQMGASMQANAARQSYTTGTATVRTPGSYPSHINFQAQTNTYDPARAAAAQSVASANINAQMQRNMAGIDAQAQMQSYQAANMLRRETVMPGMMVGGRVVLHAEDVTPNVPLEITVLIGGDDHRFICDTAGH